MIMVRKCGLFMSRNRLAQRHSEPT